MLLTVKNGEMIGNWFQAEVLFCLHIISKFFSLHPFQWEMVKMETTFDRGNSFHTHKDTYIHIDTHAHTLKRLLQQVSSFFTWKTKIEFIGINFYDVFSSSHIQDDLYKTFMF